MVDLWYEVCLYDFARRRDDPAANAVGKFLPRIVREYFFQNLFKPLHVPYSTSIPDLSECLENGVWPDELRENYLLS